jgi:hypothetical protein
MSDRELAEQAIDSIDRNLNRWVGWFPDERSEVNVPRNELLALKKYAEIGLAAPELLSACEAFIAADNQCGASLAFDMAKKAIAKTAGVTQ